MANNLSSFTNMVGNIGNQISQSSIASSMSSIDAAVQQSGMSKQMMDYSNQGMLASMGLELKSTEMNIEHDLKTLAKKIVFNALTKQVDQFAYSEMVREKMTNLFMDMEKQRTENAFTRSKSSAQSMKY